MPIYDFINLDTKEVFEVNMSIADKETFLKENPNINSYFGNQSGNMVIDPVRLGVRKVPAGFREVLRDIHHRTPGSKMDKFSDV